MGKAKTASTKRTIGVYGSYNFIEKDPVIDVLRTLIADDPVKLSKIHEVSGVHQTTLYAWFYGITRNPKNSSIEAVFRALGYERPIVKAGGSKIVTRVVAATIEPKKEN